MPQTPNHGIVYPTGNQSPNVPLVMQQQAESTELALNEITMPPAIVCVKDAAQTLGTAKVFQDVTWDIEKYKYGITHAANSASFVVTESGFYLINARVAFGNGTGTGTAVATVNGQEQLITRTDQTGNADAWPKPTFSNLLQLNAGDVVKVRAYHTVANTPLSTTESSFQLIKQGVFS